MEHDGSANNFHSVCKNGEAIWLGQGAAASFSLKMG